MRLTRGARTAANARRKAGDAAGLLVILLLAGLFMPACSVSGDHSSPDFTHLRRSSKMLSVEGVKGVHVSNLVGSITVEGVDAGGIEIVAAFTAGGATQDAAQELAETLKLATRRDGEKLVIEVAYPLERGTRFLDPALARSGGVQITGGSPELEREDLEGRYGGRAVEVSRDPGANSALLLADVVVRVPRDLPVQVTQLAGEIHAMKTDATLGLELSSGEIQVRRVTGPLSIDLRTGFLRVMDSEGQVEIGTGQAVIELVRYMGDMRISAKQGVIELREAYASKLFVETESGSISLNEVTGSIEARTEAAEIEAEYLRASERFSASSSSGAVRIRGDFSAAREVLLSSESGEVELGLSDAPPIALLASTASGSLDVKLPGLDVSASSASELVGRLGTEEGQIRVESQEGLVRIFRVEPPAPMFRDRM